MNNIKFIASFFQQKFRGIIYPVITFLLCPWFLPAQVTDNFSDGDFTTNPTWSGDDTLWVITSGRLNSNCQVPNSFFYLRTPCTLINASQWEFYSNLEISTSSVNYADIFLTSDSANLKGNNSGYFVRIGNTKDEVSLYRKDAGSSTVIIDGKDSTLCYTSGCINNPLKVRVTHDSTGTWKLETDYGLTGSFTVQGAVTDTTYKTSTWFGILVRQSTASFFNKHFFDDIYAGTITGDTIPPSIFSVSVISSTQIDVKFSETVEIITSETESNYLIGNGIGNPVSALRNVNDSSRVHLTLSNPLSSGNTYLLTALNISDLTGNVLASDSSSFTYFLYIPASFKNVVINEIMADPDPPVSLPNSEFIEIYNAGKNVFDLFNWTVTDGVTTAALPAKLLLPGQYLIICSTTNATLYLPFGDVVGLSTWPSLNNTGDLIILTDSTGTVIDSIRYYDTWYNDEVKEGGGWSLELVNPLTSCSYTNNWKASNNFNGGTPGQQNSVFDTLDNTLPFLSSVTVDGSNIITVNFSEPLDSSSLANGIFSASNGISITGIQFTNPLFVSLQITFSTQLDTGIFYTLTVSNLLDCAGNIILPNSAIQFVIGLKPQEGDIIINEIFADPTPSVGLPEAEFLELFNTTGRLVDLSGCTISGEDIQAGTYIGANDYLIICGTSYTAALSSFGDVAGLSAFNSSVLTNAGETVSLVNSYGNIIDKVTYSDSWYRDVAKDDGGWSLERINPFSPCSFSNNWIVSLDPKGGTPGSQNSKFDTIPDLTPPYVKTVYVLSPAIIEVVFSEAMDSISLVNGIYTVDNGISVMSVSVSDSIAFSSVKLTLNPDLQPNVQYTITATGVTDCPDNLIGTGNTSRFVLPETPLAGDLIINEVLFNARPYGVDFVEIYNKSGRYIDLAVCRMANTENDSIANLEVITPLQRIIYPGEFVVCTEDSGNIKKEYPQSKPGTFIVMDLPTYNDDSGTVVLLVNQNQVSDSFKYRGTMHFALIDDPDGISLERLDFNRSTNDAGNWHSASETAGWATPGFANSQFHPAISPTEAITIDPEIFSPDNDGYNDVLNIGYKMDGPGYVANASVYDSHGRFIITLLQNELLGTEGTFSWDGTTVDREKARIGIYIIYLEVFDLKGNVKQYKKSCVVGGRVK
ncbi:MAG: lamin tail domain-containing protein [Bacteroidetes bacterium]|nr:lamin tail domain-containing protein [Bacteroidota bacterium]